MTKDSRGSQAASSTSAGASGSAASTKFDSLHMPTSPAARGYMANPYQSTVEEAHSLLHQYLAPDSLLQQDSRVDNAVQYSLRQRQSGDPPGRVPVFRGTTFIPHHRPVEILNCIHLFSYRLLWDTRMSSGRVMQRYSQYQFLFYAVFRGIGTIFHPRDAIGVQDVRCWGPNSVPQSTALADTEQVDIIFKTVDTAEFSAQEDKVRMQIHLGAYRIEWREDLQGCNVTMIGDVDINDMLPTYLWNVLSKELPLTVARLRSSIDNFGIPPYILDTQECVVIQIVSYYPETKTTNLKCHVRRAGTYSVVLDRSVMYSSGIQWPPRVDGEGAHAVRVDEWENQIQVTVGLEGVGQEFNMSIHPIDSINQPASLSEWW